MPRHSLFFKEALERTDIEDSNVRHQNTVLDFTQRYAAVREAKSNNIPELARSAGRIAKKQLQVYLQGMFDNVDDSLFDYADKAENNQQQTLYFDAMREIRVQRSDVEKIFSQSCERLSNQVLNGGHINDDMDGSAGNDDNNAEITATLSLVEEDDLEESLAMTNMVSKAHTLYREELIAIAHRYDDIVELGSMTSDNNPVSPDLICKAFELASERFSDELEIRLIVYKLFDKFVIGYLGAMYKEINAMFVAAGVLPVIKLKAPVTSNASASATRPSYVDEELLPGLQAGELVEHCPDASPASNGVSANGHMFESLQQLLALQRVGAPAYADPTAPVIGAGTGLVADRSGSGSSGQAAPDGGASHGVPGFYVTNDIVTGLSHLQVNPGGVACSDTTLGENAASGEGIKASLLQAIDVRQDGTSPKKLEHAESDVIDIVSMMFDFILDDKTLSDAIRALIARLQIPIIKLAILDKTFFSKKTHAARQLLNELAYAGSVLDDEPDSHNGSLYNEVSGVVDCILSEFNTDVSIFDALLLKFRDFIETELEANKLAGEMLEDVKQKVSDKIEESMRQYKIPVFVHDLLVGRWKDVLTEIGLRDHCDGPGWQVALDLVDNLIWSVQPKLQVGERQELVRIIPKVLNGLQDGLMLIGTPQDDIDLYLQQLETLHLACLRGVAEAVVPARSHAAITGESDMTRESGSPSLEADEQLEYTGPAQAMANNQIQAFVREMDIGVWVEFYNQDKIKRGKLSWKCDFTGDYTFVDRRYRVVADIAMSDLVCRLESGKAAIVEDVPLLDRAIDAVVSSMKRCVDGAHDLAPTM